MADKLLKYSATEIDALLDKINNGETLTTAEKERLSNLQNYTHPNDANTRHVSDNEKATWNAKSNFSGSYTDLTNQPTIPTPIDVIDNLVSASTTSALSANQGKVLGEKTNTADELISQLIERIARLESANPIPPPENENIGRIVAYVVKPWEDCITAMEGLDQFKDYKYDSALLCLPVDCSFANNSPFCDVTESQINMVCDKVESLGLKPILKMHTVSLNEDGQGNTDRPQNPSAWFVNYRTLVNRYADIVVKRGYNEFIISNEMHNVMNISANKPYMLPIIADIKAKGLKVSMSMNTPEVRDNNGFQFYDELDFYCMNTYPQLTTNGIEWARDNYQKLKDGFYTAISSMDIDYGTLFAEMGGSKNLFKDIWITEFGCVPRQKGLLYPAFWGDDSNNPYNEEIQKLWLQPMFDVVENDQKSGRLTSRVKAYALWDGNSDSDFNPIGNQAQSVLEEYWSKADNIPVEGVTLNKTEHTFSEFNTLQLTHTLIPAYATIKTVSYATSNNGVATVNKDGLVTAKANGSCVITATTSNGQKTATCKINVDVSVAPPTGEITVVERDYYGDVSNVTVRIQGTSTVTNASYYEAQSPDGWIGVATVVDNGFDIDISWINSARAFNNCTILAKDINHNIIIESTTKFYLSVIKSTTPPPTVIPVTSVSLNKTSHTFTDFTTLQLNATVLPENATNKSVYWSSSNENVATVNQSGLVTAKGNGTTSITAMTQSENKRATCSITVNKEVTPPPADGLYFDINEKLVFDKGTAHTVNTTNKTITVIGDRDIAGYYGYVIWDIGKIRDGRRYRLTCKCNNANTFVRYRVDEDRIIEDSFKNNYSIEFTGINTNNQIADICFGTRSIENIGQITAVFSEIQLVDLDGDPPTPPTPEITYDVIDYRIIVKKGNITESYYSASDIPKNLNGNGGVDGYIHIMKDRVKYYLSLTKGSSPSQITINGMKPFNYSYIDQAYKNTWSNRGYAVKNNTLKYTVANRVNSTNNIVSDDSPISPKALSEGIRIYNCALPEYMTLTVDQNSINSVSEAYFPDEFMGICRLHSGERFHVHQNTRLLGGFGNASDLYICTLVHEFGHTTGIWDNSTHRPSVYDYSRNQTKAWFEPSDIACIKDKFPHLTGGSARSVYNVPEIKEDEPTVAFTFPKYKEEDIYNVSDLIIEGEYLGVKNKRYVYDEDLIYSLYDFKVTKIVKGKPANEIVTIKVHVSYDLNLIKGNSYKLNLKEYDNCYCSLINPTQGLCLITNI